MPCVSLQQKGSQRVRAACKAANFITELHLERALVAAATCCSGQGAARAVASTRSGQRRAKKKSQEPVPRNPTSRVCQSPKRDLHGFGAACKALNFITEMHLKRALVAAASGCSGQGAERAAASTRAGQRRAKKKRARSQYPGIQPPGSVGLQTWPWIWLGTWGEIKEIKKRQRGE
jgi:hypothetical protein